MAKYFANGIGKGHAVVTPALDLKNFKSIIHAVPPYIYLKRKPTQLQERDLMLAYLRSLELADGHNERGPRHCRGDRDLPQKADFGIQASCHHGEKRNRNDKPAQQLGRWKLH
ncbi:hypothetical protein WR25_26418 [Diploscapter pachys]|uniref:Macro domain-containing protein n=1 Tax=Diploscapter pachys TaxID=2018661 RepID=A0A2A2KQZ3_9BILA|nr:hypothetical protein WR25_26418 [Diploscapter pachys]